ncbi:MAG: IS66 family insertion sequence element accessory protein TnpB [Rhodoplanes sp.]|uniref:IS66 family insertion sequence element accessory protein TnpB n=1 Tax=Rhodoplanes sp. TaxID=1968906 RepID=UPI00180C7E95|nr:IS66 family insertion sequence element accessory protein TnpB [Rhodoplanes sp.]
MRKRVPGLALIGQETLKRNPHDGNLFVFRGRRGDLPKVVWHDGQGSGGPRVRGRRGTRPTRPGRCAGRGRDRGHRLDWPTASGRRR